jgi:hypothetical protein
VSCGGVLVRACVSRIDRDDVVGLARGIGTAVPRLCNPDHIAGVLDGDGLVDRRHVHVMFRSLAGND